MARASSMALWLVLAGGWAGCTCRPDAPIDPKPAALVPTDTAGPTEPPPAEPIPELSAEDQRLIAADPATLSVEDRRKRGYALRRKIMQNPNSPAARMLEDLRKAHAAGDLDVQKPGDAPRFETRSGDGTPQGGPPPAGSRPPAGTPAPASGAP